MPDRTVKELVEFYYVHFKLSKQYEEWKVKCKIDNLEFEYHGNDCFVCSSGGQLLCCDSCHRGA